MSEEVVEAAFSKLFGSRYVADQITVIWHAGEPLAAPVEWYERAFDIAERHRPAKLRVDHSFQTNGTLIDDRWIAFFKSRGAKVGVSLDGPARLHDAKRRDRKGAGTHAKTMQGVRQLQSAGLPFHIITVLTSESLDAADELYEFYVANGLSSVCFNVEEIEGINVGSSLAAPEIEQRFRGFLDRFLERMRAGSAKLTLREWEGAVATLATRGGAADRCQESVPLRILSIGVAGQVSSFSPEFLGMPSERYGDFVFGDILQDPLDVIAQRIEASALHADINLGIEACQQDCPWFAWCGGGAPANKLFEAGRIDVSETMACRLSRKAVLEGVLAKLESELGKTNKPSIRKN